MKICHADYELQHTQTFSNSQLAIINMKIGRHLEFCMMIILIMLSEYQDFILHLHINQIVTIVLVSNSDVQYFLRYKPFSSFGDASTADADTAADEPSSNTPLMFFKWGRAKLAKHNSDRG